MLSCDDCRVCCLLRAKFFFCAFAISLCYVLCAGVVGGACCVLVDCFGCVVLAVCCLLRVFFLLVVGCCVFIACCHRCVMLL